MRGLRITLAASVLVAILGGILGCEEKEIIIPPSQYEWTQMGWEAWQDNELDDAVTNFGNALKIDNNYMPAYNGFGWTYMRLQDTAMSVDYFEDGILYGASTSNTDADKRALYVGLAYALEADDDFDRSIVAGETYVAMDPNYTWKHPHHDGLTAYDAYIVLAIDYFAKGNSGKCVGQIHHMQNIIDETPPYAFTNWSALAAKLEDMIGKDPS